MNREQLHQLWQDKANAERAYHDAIRQEAEAGRTLSAARRAYERTRNAWLDAQAEHQEPAA